jgi:hypothetical protein
MHEQAPRMTPRPRRAPAQAGELGAPSRQAVRAAQRRLRLQGAQADPVAVVQVHVDAVRTRDPALMAADYTPEARIRRGLALEIPLLYFARAVQRLGSSQLQVHALELAQPHWERGDGGLQVLMRWELLGGPAHGTRGLDTFTVLNDRIVDQHVQLHTPDY